MTEFSDSKPVDDSPFFELMTRDAPEILAAISRFDEARADNLDKFATVVTAMYDPDGPKTPDDSETPDLTKEAVAFAKVASHTLHGQQHLEEKISFLIKIFQESSAERAKLFGSLSPSADECVERWEDEELEPKFINLTTDAEGIDEAVLRIQDFYLTDLTFDVKSLAAQIVEYKSANSEPTDAQVTQTTFEIKKTPKDHAIDVVKIAGGALAALLAYDRIRRDRGQ